MKLYDIPNRTIVKVDGEQLLFHMVDGMHAICRTTTDQVIELNAWQEVEEIVDEAF